MVPFKNSNCQVISQNSMATHACGHEQNVRVDDVEWWNGRTHNCQHVVQHFRILHNDPVRTTGHGHRLISPYFRNSVHCGVVCSRKYRLFWCSIFKTEYCGFFTSCACSRFGASTYTNTKFHEYIYQSEHSKIIAVQLTKYVGLVPVEGIHHPKNSFWHDTFCWTAIPQWVASEDHCTVRELWYGD